MFRTIRAKLTAYFVMWLGITLVALSLLAYRYISKSQEAEFDISLYNHIIDVATVTDMDFLGNVSVELFFPNELKKFNPFPIRRSFLQMRNNNGAIVAKSSNLSGFSLPLSKEGFNATRNNGLYFETIKSDLLPTSAASQSGTYRVLSYLVRKPGLPELILQVAVPMTYVEQRQQNVLEFLLIAIPLILLVAWKGGTIFTKKALSPIIEMTDKTETIEIQNFKERIPIPAGEHEISILGKTINRLLDKIEAAAKTNAQFVADSSHQLKTPLSILKGELHLLQSKARSPKDTKDTYARISGEVDQLIQLIERLLLLARMDASSEVICLEKLDLTDLLVDAIQKLRILAQNKRIQIVLKIEPEADVDFSIPADRHLLPVLFENLIENAIKYSPADAEVSVTVRKTVLSSIVVLIKDRGPGIPDEIKKKIFDRFYRAPRVSITNDGFGLGLSIARQIAHLHGVEIAVSSKTENDTGTEFSVVFKTS